MFTDVLRFNVDNSNSCVQYIELERFIVNNSVYFVNIHNGQVLNKFTQELKEKGKIRLESGFEICSLYDKELLVTLNTPDGLIEMVCQTLYPRGLANPMSKACTFNLHGLKKLRLTQSEQPTYTHLFQNLGNFSFPPNVHVYKVEVKGQHCVKPYHVLYPGDGKWSPPSDLKADMIDILYNYEDRVIMLEYCDSKDTGHGRRSSSGWVSYYKIFHARGTRYFSTLVMMNYFFETLPSSLSRKNIKLKNMKNFPHTGNVFEKPNFYFISDSNTPRQLLGYVHLEFNEPVSYNTLFEALGMHSEGCFTWEEARP